MKVCAPIMVALLLIAVSARAGSGPDSRPKDPGRVFDTVWSQVDRHYWDAGPHGVDWWAARDRYRPQALAAPDEQTLYVIINRMLDLLHDSHTFALSPSEARDDASRDAGKAQASFGFASWRDGDVWQVYEVVPGSSADRAGVRPGWRLVSINGDPVDRDRRPAAGDQAQVAFVDETGRSRRVGMTASMMSPGQAARVRQLPGNVLLITLDGFDGHEDRRVAAALNEYPAPAGVILDLRDNDGGEEGAAARVAGLFFADRRILLRRIDRRSAHDVAIAGAGPSSYTGPLAVLVGPRSASAAEALAAMLAESGRADSVGLRTAGALTGAEVKGLPDGGQLSLAMFDVRTPGDQRIEGRGFVPAHIVAVSPVEMAAGRDPALAEALRLVRARSASRLSLSSYQTLHARP